MATERELKIFDFVDKVKDIETIVELNREFGKLIASYGFDKWACLQVSTGIGHIKEPLRRFFGNPPLAWLERYKKNGYIKHDVAAHHVMIRTEPFWWSDIIDECHLEKVQRLVFEEAREFGMKSGLAIPIRFPDGSVWSCLLTSEHPDESDEIKYAMYLAAQFYASRGMFLKDTKPIMLNLNSRLTRRQREVVEILRKGYTQRQVGEFLGLSESTIFNMTNEAKERMGCKTIAELVAECILCGEIETNYKN